MPPIAHSLMPIFRSGINKLNYNAIISGTKGKTVGRLPHSIRDFIMKGRSAEKCAENIYGETAGILRGIDKLERQAFKRIPATNKNYKEIARILDSHTDLSLPIGDIYKYADDLFTEKQTEILLQAEESMLGKFKTLMPDLKNIVLSPLGEGNFSRTYKLSFQFNDSAKSIKPQVLKIYRDEPIAVSCAELSLRFLRNVSNKTYAEVEQCCINPKKARKIDIKEVLQSIKDIKSQNYGSFGHGALAEANTTEYIRYMSGHRINSANGLLLPDMYFFGDTKFAVSEFLDKNASAKRQFDFGRLGLFHSDFEFNSGNGIGGICIDPGGVMPVQSLKGKPSAIVGDKTGTRILKHFSRLNTKEEKAKYIEELIDNSSKQKNLIERSHTLDAVDEILGTRLNEIY